MLKEIVLAIINEQKIGFEFEFKKLLFYTKTNKMTLIHLPHVEDSNKRHQGG